MNPIHPTVVWLTWRQIFAKKRLYVAGIFALAPVFITWLFMWFSPDIAKEGRAFYLLLEKEIVTGVLLPLAALVFGTTAFGGEIDDGTLMYLLVKPVARWRIVLSKYVVAVLSTFLLMIPAIVLPWLVVRTPEIPFGIPKAFILGAAGGAVIYGAFFTMLGLTVRHALVVGLLYVLIFEEALARSIAGVRSLSIREFATSITATVADPALQLGTPSVTMATVRTMGLVFLLFSLGFSMYRLAKYQMTEKQ